MGFRSFRFTWEGEGKRLLPEFTKIRVSANALKSVAKQLSIQNVAKIELIFN